MSKEQSIFKPLPIVRGWTSINDGSWLVLFSVPDFFYVLSIGNLQLKSKRFHKAKIEGRAKRGFFTVGIYTWGPSKVRSCSNKVRGRSSFLYIWMCGLALDRQKTHSRSRWMDLVYQSKAVFSLRKMGFLRSLSKGGWFSFFHFLFFLLLSQAKTNQKLMGKKTPKCDHLEIHSHFKLQLIKKWHSWVLES